MAPPCESHVQLPQSLRTEHRAGRFVLFLGAGATVGAKSSAGARPLLADELRDALADAFLDGRHKAESLTWVAELARPDAGVRKDRGRIMRSPVAGPTVTHFSSSGVPETDHSEEDLS